MRSVGRKEVLAELSGNHVAAGGTVGVGEIDFWLVLFSSATTGLSISSLGQVRMECKSAENFKRDTLVASFDMLV